ncbi:PAS domain S-box protein [Massilia sp. YIM B02443]|uniref:bifunctional diguanylate cyclase/phosphodiesterase n=1 Tax=Massilia sp. YIM B02443 TaxID=3050127 RepID=UPI0025B70F9D|nr:PAS domain S-box protein [Massilia sp. YIM B02443]MDN4039664.1 PAS domain S-box protein [Massilia sp. YIM B02443]
MPAAPLPSNEQERLALLHTLELLDTPAEPVFDRVVRLASRLLGVPVAAFSLVDADRQWFKAKVGLAVSETPREHAFCAHAIAQDEPLVVPDAAADARFQHNPLVTGAPDIRFYAGVPVRSSNGLALGTLCAIDTQPRTLSAEERAVMVDLAAVIMREVQYRERLAMARERLQDSDVALGASEARFRAVYDIASVGISLTTREGRFISVNPAMCQILGYSEEELRGRTFAEVTYEPDRAFDLIEFRRLMAGEIDFLRRQKRYVRKDGSLIWIEFDMKRKFNAAGQYEYNVTVVKDIHAQKLAEDALAALNADLERRVAERTAELAEREAELRSVIENANDAYIRLGADGRVLAWNRQAEHTFGWGEREALGRPLEELIIPAELAGAHREGMRHALRCGGGRLIDRRVELPALRRDGSRLTVEVRIRRMEVRGEPTFSAFLHDVTLRKQQDARREYESRHDVLTGLANRRALMEALPLAQARAERRQSSLGLLFIDLDGFKAVNDAYGHEAGDELLRIVAERLRRAVRRTDSVFRLAGDEFTVLLEDLKDALRDAHTVGRKLVEVLSEPVPLQCARMPVQVRIGASIGMAIQAPRQRRTPEQLIKEADGWMYQAKKAGRGRILPAPEVEPEPGRQPDAAGATAPAHAMRKG